MYRYTKTLKGIFGGYEDVAQISDLWNFLQGDLIDGLYEEEWYNLGTDKPFPCPDGEMIQGILFNFRFFQTNVTLKKMFKLWVKYISLYKCIKI